MPSLVSEHDQIVKDLDYFISNEDKKMYSKKATSFLRILNSPLETKEKAIKAIRHTAKMAQADPKCKTMVIRYVGHGFSGTGNWVGVIPVMETLTAEDY